MKTLKTIFLFVLAHGLINSFLVDFSSKQHLINTNIVNTKILNCNIDPNQIKDLELDLSKEIKNQYFNLILVSPFKSFAGPHLIFASFDNSNPVFLLTSENINSILTAYLNKTFYHARIYNNNLLSIYFTYKLQDQIITPSDHLLSG